MKVKLAFNLEIEVLESEVRVDKHRNLMLDLESSVKLSQLATSASGYILCFNKGYHSHLPGGLST